MLQMACMLLTLMLKVHQSQICFNVKLNENIKMHLHMHRLPELV